MAFHQYNKPQYNVPQYNSDAFTWIKRLSESVGSSDGLIDNPYKVLADTVSLADAKTLEAMRSFTELMLMTDFVSNSILDKGMAERIRINDWLQIKRLTNSPNWSN